MSSITGVVEATNSKDIRTKRGVFKKFGIKIGETWYNHFDKNEPAVNKGDTVSFEATEGDYGWDINPKTLKVAQGAAPARTGDGRAPLPQAASGGASSTERYIRVSHGVNVAAQILGPLEPTADEEAERAYYAALDQWTRRIVRLVGGLVANYDAVVAQKAPKPAPAPEPVAPPPAPPKADVSFDDDDIPF